MAISVRNFQNELLVIQPFENHSDWRCNYWMASVNAMGMSNPAAHLGGGMSIAPYTAQEADHERT